MAKQPDGHPAENGHVLRHEISWCCGNPTEVDAMTGTCECHDYTGRGAFFHQSKRSTEKLNSESKTPEKSCLEKCRIIWGAYN